MPLCRPALCSSSKLMMQVKSKQHECLLLPSVMARITDLHEDWKQVLLVHRNHAFCITTCLRQARLWLTVLASKLHPQLHSSCLVHLRCDNSYYTRFLKSLNTRGSAIAEASYNAIRQLKSCQMLHNYTKNCIWKDWHRWVNWKVTKDHHKWRYLICQISLPISGLQ